MMLQTPAFIQDEQRGMEGVDLESVEGYCITHKSEVQEPEECGSTMGDIDAVIKAETEPDWVSGLWPVLDRIEAKIEALEQSLPGVVGSAVKEQLAKCRDHAPRRSRSPDQPTPTLRRSPVASVGNWDKDVGFHFDSDEHAPEIQVSGCPLTLQAGASRRSPTSPPSPTRRSPGGCVSLRKYSPDSAASSGHGHSHHVSFVVNSHSCDEQSEDASSDVQSQRKWSDDYSDSDDEEHRLPVVPHNTMGSAEEGLHWPANIERRKEFTLYAMTKSRSMVTVSQLMQYRHSNAGTESDDSDEAEGGRCQHLVLDPESRKHQLHDKCVLLAMFFDLVVMPYVIAWDLPFEGVVEVCGWLSATIWLVDLALGFFTGTYYDGELELRLERIAGRYLRKWFLPNFLALLSDVCSLVLVAVSWRRRRFLRIVGLARLHRLFWIFDGLMDRSLADRRRMLLQVGKISLVILWLNHVICCAWYFIGVRGFTDTGGRWTDTLEAVHSMEGVASFQDSGALYQYFTAFHWTISQLFSGGLEHVAPLNTIERLFNIFCLIFGLIFVTSLVSLLSATMTQFFMQKQDQVKVLRELRQWLAQKTVTPKMALRVQKQVVERLRKKRKLTDQDVPALALLSSNVRAELRYELLQSTILKFPLLRLCDRVDLETVQSLCGEGIDFRLLSPGDNLFEFGQQAVDGMYFVSSGKLRYTLKSVYAVHHLDTAEDVREGQWLCEAALWTHWSHTGTAQATVPCELQVFGAEKTLNILFKHSTIKDLVNEYSWQFHQRVIHAVPPVAPSPTDLSVPFTDFSDLVMGMSKETQAMIGEIALHEATSLGTTDSKAVSRLKAELKERTSVFVINERGEAECTVGWTQVRVERGTDGFVLACLGHCSEHGVATPKIQFPGSKQTRGEPPTDAIKHLLADLEQLLQDADVMDFTRDSYMKEASSVGLPTRCLRTTFSASVEGPCHVKAKHMKVQTQEGPQAQPKRKDSLGSCATHTKVLEEQAQDLAAKYEVYQITAGNLRGNLYAWIPVDEFTLLNEETEGTKLITHWIRLLDGVQDPTLNASSFADPAKRQNSSIGKHLGKHTSRESLSSSRLSLGAPSKSSPRASKRSTLTLQPPRHVTDDDEPTAPRASMSRRISTFWSMGQPHLSINANSLALPREAEEEDQPASRPSMGRRISTFASSLTIGRHGQLPGASQPIAPLHESSEEEEESESSSPREVSPSPNGRKLLFAPILPASASTPTGGSPKADADTKRHTVQGHLASPFASPVPDTSKTRHTVQVVQHSESNASSLGPPGTVGRS